MTILRYFFAWFGMMVLAIVNGGLRDFVYKPLLGDVSARQVSTVILLILLAGYFRFLTTIWPIRSASQAWKIGGMWFVMTEAFEFGLGLMQGDSWSNLMQAYDILGGQLWVLVPLWVLIGPYVFFRLARSKRAGIHEG